MDPEDLMSRNTDVNANKRMEKEDDGANIYPLERCRVSESKNHQGSTGSSSCRHPPSAASTPTLLQDSSSMLYGDSSGTTSTAANVIIKSGPTLRYRRSGRSTAEGVFSGSSEENLPSPIEPVSSTQRREPRTAPAQPTEASLGISNPVVQRKQSLVRDLVPAGIQTTDTKPPQSQQLPLPALKVSSPTTEKLATQIKVDEDDDDNFDWEEDKEVDSGTDSAGGTGGVDPAITTPEDVCCAPFARKIHPFVTKVVKNIVILVLLLIPKVILHHVHSHHHEVIVLIEDGLPYVAVVVGLHVAYFLIRFLVMCVFKLIHKFGTVKVKIGLETHDDLVLYIGRSVWLMCLITVWAIFVHNPTCNRVKTLLELAILEGGPAAAAAEIEANGGVGGGGVELQCRRWIFWWVYRFLWGAQAMLLLYILKRYMMQVISDRLEQDNARFVELHFQGYVLDVLQKIKHPSNKFYVHHPGFHLRKFQHPGGPSSSTIGLPSSFGNNTGGRSPGPMSSRPPSPKYEKQPSTAAVVDCASRDLPSSKRSIRELLKSSFQRRRKTSNETATSKIGGDGTTVGVAAVGCDTSTNAGSIHESDKDHDSLEPLEFVRMSRKRKSLLVHSLRNKTIDNPNKKAKDLWARICPQHRNFLKREDLDAFKKDLDRVWALFGAGKEDRRITRTMFKKGIVDMVNLRKGFTSAHKTFENAMAKLDMLSSLVVFLFAVVAFLIAFDAGIQQYAVSVSSLVVGCAFVTGSSAKNAFESMIFVFVVRRKCESLPFDVGDRIELSGSYFTITTIHILTTEMKRNDGMQVISPNYVLASRHIHNLSRASDHIDNVYMDVPLFTTTRTIQRLRDRIQHFIDTEAKEDYFKIDVILNATNSHTKDGTSRACLQVLFRVHHKNKWIDPTFSPRKLKSILFLRATLNELELEDLKELLVTRRSLGDTNGTIAPPDGQNPTRWLDDPTLLIPETIQHAPHHTNFQLMPNGAEHQRCFLQSATMMQ
ncbi:hypothetical protein BGZ83_001575 [Gryganskiella cystojenkinii]|nr:hypothetical protein BGZ83_001575 [Gryganskiella cystojenkinii]